MAYHVSACWLCRISKECVRCRLDLVGYHYCNIVDFRDSDQLVHDAIKALLSICKRAPSSKFSPMQRNYAVNNNHLCFEILDILAHGFDDELKVTAVVCLAYGYSL